MFLIFLNAVTNNNNNLQAFQLIVLARYPHGWECACGGGQTLQVPVLVAAANIVQGVASNASDGESTYMWAPYACSLVVYWMYAAVTVC